MSIIPGIENLAPERTLTSSGSSGVAQLLAHLLLDLGDGLGHLGVEAGGGQPLTMYSRQASVVIVKPGGTGSSRTEVISARLAPLPPSRSLRLMGGLRCL